jgi:Pre-SET motif
MVEDVCPLKSILSHIQSDNEQIDIEVMNEDGQILDRKTHKTPPHPPHFYTNFLSVLDNISGPPVWVVNDIDSEPCPPLVFQWIEEYYLGAGVPVRDDHFSTGCSCPGDECDLRDPNACECLDDSEEKKFAYDINGLIHHPPGTAIIECNNRCGCGRSCPNRVVQRGRRMPLEIFKTQKKGWGSIIFIILTENRRTDMSTNTERNVYISILRGSHY